MTSSGRRREVRRKMEIRKMAAGKKRAPNVGSATLCPVAQLNSTAALVSGSARLAEMHSSTYKAAADLRRLCWV